MVRKSRSFLTSDAVPQLDWNDIRIFLEAARKGSFSSAAHALAVNQATVSRRIDILEEHVGASLFRRSRVGVSLTELGLLLLDQARCVEEAIVRFRQTLSTAVRQPERPVAIKASEGVCSYYLTPLMTRQRIGPMGLVLDMLPDISLPPIRFVSDRSSEAGDIEFHWLAPGSTLPGRPSDKMCKLAKIRFIPFISTAYTGPVPQSFDAIGELPTISLAVYEAFDRPEALGPWVQMLTGGAERCTTVAWTSAAEKLLLAGVGIALLPSYAPLYSDAILPIDIDIPPMYLELWIRSEAEALQEPMVRKAFDEITKAFRAFDW
jgi:DNA-binding transcriptional LysR family regulator